MKNLQIKKKKSDYIVNLCCLFLLFLILCGVGMISIMHEEKKDSEKVEVYCQEFFDENKEQGYFKEKDLEELINYIEKEYNFKSKANGNILESKDDMFLSVEIYKNVDGKIRVIDKYYFE